MAFSGGSLMIISTCCILVFVPYAASLTFRLPNITPQNQNRDIVTEGETYISDGGIQVTPDGIGSDRSQRAGRETYIRPLHLWDNKSGELASFRTNFSFVIDSNGATTYADGLTFFLADNNSMITAGGAMGLPVNATTIFSTSQFVAVEFDTFWNEDWDPRDSTNTSIGDHVGININSIDSVRSHIWLSDISSRRLCRAWIDYDSVSQNLSVSFTSFQDNANVWQVGLYYTIDLREVLPEWVIFGFSAATGAAFQKNNVRSWSFDSSELQIDKNNTPPLLFSPPTAGPAQAKGKNWTGLVVGLIVGLCVLIAFLAMLPFVLWGRKKKKNNGVDEVEEFGFNVEMTAKFEMGAGPKRFSYHELARSTGDFAENEKLGEGGFGGVYRGFLKDSRTYVAVKRVSKTSKQGIKEYASEVLIISRLRHKNLVQLIGWCHEKGELLLVYEFMQNGSLDAHLFNAKSLLTWGTRYKIAHGLASGLLYLHEEWEQCVLHRDIKSSNVMLDSNFNAKLGDFGLAKLVDHEKGSYTTTLAGTLGYLAPECVVTGRASKESDVFSFGVVALEIACRRKPVKYNTPEKQTRLVELVWGHYGTRTLLEAVDLRLGSDFVEEEVERLMIVGLWCVHPDSDLRPSVRQAIQVLKFEASLPILPPNMPVPTYFAQLASYLYGTTSILQSQTLSSGYNINSSKLTASSTRYASASSSASMLHSMP